jgi:hypothetical protein
LAVDDEVAADETTVALLATEDEEEEEAALLEEVAILKSVNKRLLVLATGACDIAKRPVPHALGAHVVVTPVKGVDETEVATAASTVAEEVVGSEEGVVRSALVVAAAVPSLPDSEVDTETDAASVVGSAEAAVSELASDDSAVALSTVPVVMAAQ